MKNYMKKIIVAIFAFVLLLVGQEVFASSIWNEASNDCRTIAIANYTANEGYGDPCWNLSSVDSEPGDSINVRVYYHNTSKITATNTRIILNQNNSSNGKTYSGSIVSDQGSLSFGPVNLTLPEGQTLSFSSAKWYPNQTRTPASFPSGQSGSDLMDGGINIGSIAPSWSSQGSIVAVFRVSNTVPEPELSCSISSFTASTTSLYLGNYSILNWKTENCTKVTISPSLDTTIQNSGSYKLFPKNTTTYRLSAYKGLNVVDTKDVTISIIKILQTTGNLTPSSSSCTIPSGASTCLIPFTWTTENPTTTSSVTSNGQTLATGNNGSKSFAISNGSQSFYLYHNSIELDREEVSASCASGSSWTGSYCKQNVVIPDSCTITSFDANDTSIEKGDYVTISWKTENCNYVNIPGIGTNLFPNGSKIMRPSYSTTYAMTAYGTNNIDSDTLKVYVDENIDEEDDECRVTDFSVDDSSISEGDSVRLEWETEGCDYVNIAGVGSNLSENGSKRVYPNSTKTYTLKAYGENGDDSDTVKVYVDEEDEYIDNTPVVIYNSCAVTTVATNINKNGAYLNGLVTNSNSYSSNVYFEYGATASLGSRTQTRTIYSNGSFSEVIAGLSPNTIYFFRAVSDCNNGTSFGSIEVFRTLGNDVVRPVIIQGNTIVGEKSPVMLDITNRYPTVSIQDTIDYTVTYKNIGKTTLRDPMLQVIVPSYISIINSSEGTYSNETHTLSVPLSDLQKDESGVVYLEGLVESIPSNNAKIVSTAVLVYTNTDNGQENAMAYVLNTPRDMIQIIENNSLGAAALFGNFCSTGLIWWLLIIIIILLIILITRSYQQKKTVKTETTHISSVK